MIQQLIFTFKTLNLQQLVTNNAKVRLVAAMFGHVMMRLFLKCAEGARAAGYCQTWQGVVTIEKVRAKLVGIVFTPTWMRFAYICRLVDHFHVHFSASVWAVRHYTIRCAWITLIGVLDAVLKFRISARKSNLTLVLLSQASFEIPTESLVVFLKFFLVAKNHAAFVAFKSKFVHNSAFLCICHFVRSFFFVQNLYQRSKNALRLRRNEDDVSSFL